MDVTYLLRQMEALRHHHSNDEDASSSPYPSNSRDSSSSLSLLQALQRSQDGGGLSSAELLSAGMSDVWRASASISRLVTNAGNGIKTAVFRNSGDRYGLVRSFTAFDNPHEVENWSSLCMMGMAFDMSDMNGRSQDSERENATIYFTSDSYDENDLDEESGGG